MDTIFMNSKNSKTFNPHKLLLMDYWCSGYHFGQLYSTKSDLRFREGSCSRCVRDSR